MDKQGGQPAKKMKKTGRRPKENPGVAPGAEGEAEQIMNDHGQLPSQAEGERTDERGAAQMNQSAAEGELREPKLTPSQAEGDRETIDEDLREKGGEA